MYKSAHVDDINQDGTTDIAIWGGSNDSNCLVSYFYNETTHEFTHGPTYSNIEPTTNPFVISYGQTIQNKTIGLLVFLNGSRTLLTYRNSS